VAAPLEIVVKAGFETALMIKTDACRALVTLDVSVLGRALARNLSPSDDPLILAPVTFGFAGGEARGCVLALPDRALFAWWTGWVNRTIDVAVVPYSTMTGIAVGTRPGSLIGLPRRMIELTADRRWTVIVPNVYGEFPMAGLLAAIFERAVVQVTLEALERVDHRARRRRERADLLLLA
jgi:hypothetical protein